MSAHALRMDVLTKEGDIDPELVYDVVDTAWSDRHPATQGWMERFKIGHLVSPELRLLSSRYTHLAWELAEILPDGPDLTRSLSSLWEAKNEAVYTLAAVIRRETGHAPSSIPPEEG